MTRQFDIREPSLAALQAAPVYFRYGSNHRRILIDALTARALLAVYGALDGDAARVNFNLMLVSSPEKLERLVNFCWKHVGIGGPQ